MLLGRDCERQAVADLRAKVKAGNQKCALCKAAVNTANLGAILGTDAGAFFLAAALCSSCAAKADKASPAESRTMFAALHKSWHKYLAQLGRVN